MAQDISLAVRSGTTIGFDLGDKYTHYTVLTAVGKVKERGRVRTTPLHLERFLGDAPRSLVALEVGTHSPWVSRLVTQCGHEVVVANPRQIPLITRSIRKSDATDSEMLARLARVDRSLLTPIRHRGVVAQADLALLRSREALVRSRTLLVNFARGAVKSFGGRIPSGISTEAFAVKAGEHIPEDLRDQLAGVMTSLGVITAQIRKQERAIRRLAKTKYREAETLMAVPGVGILTALTYVLTIEDPHRFTRSRDVGPYLGLVPRRSASGAIDPELRITKAGDTDLRRLLVQCAHCLLSRSRVDSDLKRWGLKLVARGKKNAKKRAVVAVARKLAVLLHRLWVSGEGYVPLRNASPSIQAEA